MAIVTRPAYRNAEVLAKRYVDLVGSLPDVDRVLLERTAAGYRIWTVIVAEPFDDSRRVPVYEAELDALQDGPEVRVDFRVVNLAELPTEAHDSALPRGAKILFRR